MPGEEVDQSLPSEATDREAHRKLFRRLGAWGLANTMRQASAVSRAAAAQKYPEVAEAAKLLEEVPFGGQVNIMPASGSATKLIVGIVGALLFGLACVIGGYLIAMQVDEPAPVRPPIDAVLEWEISDVRSGNGNGNIP